MSVVKEQIIAKLDKLPEPCLADVLEMVDSLVWRGGDQSESLLSVAGILSGEPITSAQIEKELYGGGKMP
jgi:hypothetical protein